VARTRRKGRARSRRSHKLVPGTASPAVPPSPNSDLDLEPPGPVRHRTDHQGPPAHRLSAAPRCPVQPGLAPPFDETQRPRPNRSRRRLDRAPGPTQRKHPDPGPPVEDPGWLKSTPFFEKIHRPREQIKAPSGQAAGRLERSREVPRSDFILVGSLEAPPFGR